MTDVIARKIIGFLILFGPLIWEINNDRLGDKDKRLDVIKRGVFMAFVSAINAALNGGRELIQMAKAFVLSLNMALAIFVAFFDYWINAVLIKNKILEIGARRWFSYLGQSSDVDKWAPWANLKPGTRFIIRAGYLIIATTIYFIWI